MSDNSPAATPRIAVAGDVCLDVVALAAPPTPADVSTSTNNWRSTGETRTFFLPGGTLLMKDMVRAAVAGAGVVEGPRFKWPSPFVPGARPHFSLSGDQLLTQAMRLTRDEIVHSLLSLAPYPEKPKSKDERIRVEHTHGFSGPKDGDPRLPVLPPDSAGNAAVVVLDDTGNQFRRSPDEWPDEIKSGAAKPWIVHKLHRPLPSTFESLLWKEVRAKHADRHIVIVSIDDLRAPEADAPISRGLSWERTATDLVWQLLNVETFAALKDCDPLIVRLEIDGALYWTTSLDKEGRRIRSAILIYDPAGIEGSAEESCDGSMVGFGTAFVAGIVQAVSKARVPKQRDLLAGVETGLTAARKLRSLGFGAKGDIPQYPCSALFGGSSDGVFAEQPVPIIEGATTPDRGYWRLLDTVFASSPASLQRAVDFKATGSEPALADEKAKKLLREAPLASFAKALTTYDRSEIESYRALYRLMRDYVRTTWAERPLSVAVFGPPGAGKSFGVKMVAKELVDVGAGRKITDLTFNLSQYQAADELAAAFHLVRDSVLRGEVPLVFFDEFDTALNGVPLGWLRYFLNPMQDAEFLDRGTPHPIGQAIFVFAGGTCGSYAEFARPLQERGVRDKEFEEFKKAKGPDFLSRLRATLDIPGLDLDAPFDAYGPVERFPCEAAILLRRANILKFQLGKKAPHLKDATGALQVSKPVLRALLHAPQFAHGNRSFEALLDMSRLHGVDKFTPSSLPATGHTNLHANAAHLTQLLAATYPFSDKDREAIAKAIHADFVAERKATGEFTLKEPSHHDWDELSEELQGDNFKQADDIPRKLRLMNRWLRKTASGRHPLPLPLNKADVERYARMEHDRWVAAKRHDGYVWGEKKDPRLRTHPCVIPWDDPRLTKRDKDKDRETIEAIPRYLAAAGFEVIEVS
jgi:hypothetical protein